MQTRTGVVAWNRCNVISVSPIALRSLTQTANVVDEKGSSVSVSAKLGLLSPTFPIPNPTPHHPGLDTVLKEKTDQT
jgi:hypothetical protein